MNTALEVFGLTKRFNSFIAVDGITFSVFEGEIVGLLGPNGAGKTTTMQMLLGLITPDSGSISYFGHNFSKKKSHCLSMINFASAYSELNHKLSVFQNLRIYAGLYGIQNWKEVIFNNLELLEISEEQHTMFWKLSSGQKTRVILAKALLNRPKLILMDEPTASLDPDISESIIKLIQKLQSNHHVSMLYTSHNMSEVEKLCDRVLFLSHGRIIAQDTPLGLTKKIGKTTLVLTIGEKFHEFHSFIVKEFPTSVFERKETVCIPLEEANIADTIHFVKNAGFEITDIDIHKPSLEDVFLSIAKGKY
jgi:ABC-2 type transport system ATP-binding protein